MAELVKVPVTSANAVPALVPDHFHIGDVNQLTNSLHGDGFFPFEGTTTLDGVIRAKKDLNGEVIASTNRKIAIRDYIAIVDGVLLYSGSKIVFTDKQFTLLAIPAGVTGTKYVVATPKQLANYDGNNKPQHDVAIFSLQDSATVTEDVLLVAKLINIPASGNLTSANIDNSGKKFLQNIDNVKGSGDVVVPTDLVQRIDNLEALTSQAGINTKGYTVTPSDIGPGSTNGIDANGNIVLPLTSAQAIISDNFNGSDGSPVNPAKWVSTAFIRNNQAVVIDGNGGAPLLVGNLTSVADVVDGVIEFDLYLKPSFRGYADGEINVRQFSNNRYYMGFNVHADPATGIVDSASINLSKITNDGTNGYAMGSGQPSILNGQTMDQTTPLHIRVKIVMNQGFIGLFYNGQVVCEGVDTNPAFAPVFVSGKMGIWSGYDSAYYGASIAVDNLTYVPFEGTTYALSGAVTTVKLASVDPIATLTFEATDEKPAGTTVAYQISLDGGGHYVAVVDGQVVDGTVAPWSSAGNDVKVKIAMTTSDSAVTPVVSAVRVNTSSGVILSKYLDLKAKVNEIITAINGQATPLATPIDPLA